MPLSKILNSRIPTFNILSQFFNHKINQYSPKSAQNNQDTGCPTKPDSRKTAWMSSLNF